ncbi:hypothetical protein V8G54_018666 [Vigna mungo]|uniref:Uncharacterized protein n=1 Tax=Vigna mungo TaxID=3915 RepID=A0AAQ3NA98_VIGMU
MGVHKTFDTICIYLESYEVVGSLPDKDVWVRYKMAVVNQKDPAKTMSKELAICTKTWNNSVLQFMKVTDTLEVDARFLVCEILDYCPCFEYSDSEVLTLEDDQGFLTSLQVYLDDPAKFNARSESIDEKASFRRLLPKSRCLVAVEGKLERLGLGVGDAEAFISISFLSPEIESQGPDSMGANIFYEWKKDGSKKQPYYIHFKDGRPLVFAALYDSWQNSEGETLYTFTIVTTSSSSALQWLHGE